MATCNFIRESHQNASAMRAVIRYVSQEKKTVDTDGRRYLSGVGCGGTCAYDEFLATKNLYRKTDGVWFYQYTQSFAPGEIDDPAEAHDVGRRLAEEFFPGCEVLVATHLDAFDEAGRQRVHNHFIINSVMPEDGRKVHFDRHTLERMRVVSDRLCAERGLSVQPPYRQEPGAKTVGTREYRAAVKGEGWKFALINDIEAAMRVCISRDEFIDLMTAAGYGVTWTDERKYITYTCPGGQRVRDNKLHENKFLKENMEYEFTIRKRIFEPTAANTDEICPDGRPAEVGLAHNALDARRNAVPADRVRDPEGRLEAVLRSAEGSRDLPADAVREDRSDRDAGGDGRELERPDAGSVRLVGKSVEDAQRRGTRDPNGVAGGGGFSDLDPAQDIRPAGGRDEVGWGIEREILIRTRLERDRTAGCVYGGDEEVEEIPAARSDRDDLLLGDPQPHPLSRAAIKAVFRDCPPDEEDAALHTLLGSLLLSGDWLGPDVREGTAHLYKAERGGSADAALALGHFYIRAKNKPHAIEQLSLAAGMGSAMAEYELAKLLLFDADLTDWQKAADHLAASARMGNEYAYKALCRMAEDPLLRAATSAAQSAVETEPMFRGDKADGQPQRGKQAERCR